MAKNFSVRTHDGVILLFDSLRDPRDVANVIHLGLAAGVRVELTGSSLAPTHPKVLNILTSWLAGFGGAPRLSHVKQSQDFFARVKALKKQGFVLVGTSSTAAATSIFESDLSKGKHVIVFGTETSGLSAEKLAQMDLVVRVPMLNSTNFFTISAVAPLICYEVLRQKKLI